MDIAYTRRDIIDLHNLNHNFRYIVIYLCLYFTCVIKDYELSSIYSNTTSPDFAFYTPDYYKKEYTTFCVIYISLSLSLSFSLFLSLSLSLPLSPVVCRMEGRVACPPDFIRIPLYLFSRQGWGCRIKSFKIDYKKILNLEIFYCISLAKPSFSLSPWITHTSYCV